MARLQAGTEMDSTGPSQFAEIGQQREVHAQCRLTFRCYPEDKMDTPIGLLNHRTLETN